MEGQNQTETTTLLLSEAASFIPFYWGMTSLCRG
jgi:hypothetical protein